MSTKSKSKILKHQITDTSKVNTFISDRIIYYDNEGLLNLIKFKDPKKDSDKIASLFSPKKKSKSSLKALSKR